MRAPLLAYLSVAFELLPAIAALFARDRLTPARRWVVLWCVLLMLQDVVSFVLGLRHTNNLWVGYLAAPLSGAIALWMLSLWQDTRTRRLALRLAIPPFVVVSTVLSVAVDDPTTFSFASAPFQYLVLLFAALWTFVRRSLDQREGLTTSGWFWILTGFMLYNGISIAQQAVVWYLYDAGQTDLIQAVFRFKELVQIAAFTAIAGGMLCPAPPKLSGWPSSRRA